MHLESFVSSLCTQKIKYKDIKLQKIWIEKVTMEGSPVELWICWYSSREENDPELKMRCLPFSGTTHFNTTSQYMIRLCWKKKRCFPFWIVICSAALKTVTPDISTSPASNLSAVLLKLKRIRRVSLERSHSSRHAKTSSLYIEIFLPLFIILWLTAERQGQSGNVFTCVHLCVWVSVSKISWEPHNKF